MGRSSGQGWQEQVRGYDRDGPGLVGYYLDLVSLLASLCPLIVEEQAPETGQWAATTDPVLIALLAGYTSQLAPQDELVALHVRHRESMGEAWIVYDDTLGWMVLTVPNVKITRDGIQYTDPYGVQRTAPKSKVWKSWVQDPYLPYEPTSPLRRALPDVRRLRAAVRNQTRTAESRLVMNGMVAFPDDGNGARPLASDDGTTSFTGVDQVVDDYLTLAKAAFRDDDHPAAAVPFPYIGAPAVPVDLGRQIDATAMEVETKAVESFARSVNFPAQLLTLGPGSANHWNEWLLDDAQRKQGLAPKLKPVCADISTVFLRPMIERAKQRLGDWTVDPRRVRVWFDSSFLTAKPDTTAQMLQAWSQGIASREEVMDALGITRPLALPEGMDEYEHWQLATGKPGAPYAEVEDGQLVVAPDVFGDGTDAAELPVVPGAPPVEDAQVVEAAGGRELPAAPPMVAAVGDRVTVERVLGRLARADLAMEASLSAQTEACIRHAIDYTAKEVVKAHPARSPERARLRSLPAVEVWQAASPEVRASFPLRDTVEEAVAQCDRDELFAEAAAAIVALVAPFGVPDLDPDLGGLVLAGLIAGFVVSRFDSGSPARFPDSHVRAAMAAAGGAQVDAEGALVRSGGGGLVARRGGDWQGGMGMATGHEAVRPVVESTGALVEWEWQHAYFRTPQSPFMPHVVLDGQRFTGLSGIPGGYHPGDHPYCTCALIPHVNLPEVPVPERPLNVLA